jgi:hypothetical protein
MRSATLIPAWFALSSAQLLSPGQLSAIPSAPVQVVPPGLGDKVIPYDPQAAYAAAFNAFSTSNTRKRDADCAPQILGAGPIPVPDTDAAFLSSGVYSTAANTANTPAGWNLSFKNQQAAISTSGYMGYKTYNTYDPNQCAADCLAATGCQSFNIFFERDPTINPAAGCANPASTTAIKCSFWGVAFESAALTNQGQWRADFHVVIAGSNGYELTNPSFQVPGFNGTSTGTATVNAPNECGSYITFKSHQGTYDPNLCAADCAAERLNTDPFNGQTCRFFTSYQLVKNGQVQAQICALYTRTWDSSYAVNTGYFNGDDVYTIANALSYTYEADIGSFTCGVQTTSTTTTAAPTSSSTTVRASTVSPSTTTVVSSSTTTTRVSTTLSTATASPVPAQPIYGQKITACPSGSAQVVSSSGQLYTTCPNTDYQIPSPDIYYNIRTISACVEKCESSPSCTKAVYNPTTLVCYSKGSPSDSASNFVTSGSFQTIQKVADGTPINGGCPSQGVAVSAARIFFWQSPATFTKCPKTDYAGASQQVWLLVLTEQACLTLCASTPGCAKASYRDDLDMCFGKGSNGGALVVSSRFSTYSKQ